MTSSQRTIDPSRVILTGENPFIRLSATEGGEATTDASFWRILFSGGGPGHVLFIRSELTGGQTRIYSDNIAMARWLQNEIMRYMRQDLGNLELPVHQSTVQSSGDLRSYWTETIKSRDEEITLTWSGLVEPFLIHSQPGSAPTRPHGVCTLFIPAREARVTINGKQAAGKAWPTKREDRDSSTCCLAFSESWLLPR